MRPGLLQLSRYLLVGGGVGAVWLAALFGLTQAGVPQSLSSVIGFCFCVPLGFFGHRYVTFRSVGVVAVEAPRFVAKALAGLALSAIVPLLVTKAGYGVAVSAVATPVAVASVGFLVSRYWVFRHRAS